MNQEVRARQAPGRCPFCRDELADTKQVVACAGCGARHHAACHREHGACAACGAAEALYPRSAFSRAATRPPQGSRIEVLEEEGGATRLQWPLDPLPRWLWLVLGPLMVVGAAIVLPLLLIVWWQGKKWPVRRDPQGRKLRAVVFTPDALVLPTHQAGRTKTVPRQAVGAVTVGPRAEGQGWALWIDCGLKRHLVEASGPRGLSPPELEWLAERIRAWKQG